jgi:hypothetical protein
MSEIKLTRVEVRPGGQLLYYVRVNTAAGKVELPIAIMEQGSDASNETKVLQSSLDPVCAKRFQVKGRKFHAAAAVDLVKLGAA